MNEPLRKRVEVVLDMALTTVSSLSEAFTSGAPVFDEDVYGGLEKAKDLDVIEADNNEKSSIGGEGPQENS